MWMDTFSALIITWMNAFLIVGCMSELQDLHGILLCCWMMCIDYHMAECFPGSWIYVGIKRSAWNTIMLQDDIFHMDKTSISKAALACIKIHN